MSEEKGEEMIYFYIEVLDGSTWKHYNFNCQTADSNDFGFILENHLNKFRKAWKKLANK